jgi:hypothetical protein
MIRFTPAGIVPNLTSVHYLRQGTNLPLIPSPGSRPHRRWNPRTTSPQYILKSPTANNTPLQSIRFDPRRLALYSPCLQPTVFWCLLARVFPKPNHGTTSILVERAGPRRCVSVYYVPLRPSSTVMRRSRLTWKLRAMPSSVIKVHLISTRRRMAGSFAHSKTN